MIINHNLGAINANRMMGVNASAANKSMEKLSSGLKINKAGDDAAGLAISEKMRGQIRGLDQAGANSQDGISLIQTAEGALNETTSILQRMRELAVQSGNDTATDQDRAAMQTENAQLGKEIDRISSTTQFNTKNLLDGSVSKATTSQATILDSASLQDGGVNPLTTTKLTDLTDGNGNNLGLQVGDVIKINGMKNGTAVAQVSYTVTALSTMSDLTTQASIGGGTAAIGANGGIELTGVAGTANGLSNVSIKADNRALFNNTLSSFSETQTAQDTNTDKSLNLQIGANAGQTMSVDIKSMSTQALALGSIDISTQKGAQNAMSAIDNATATVSSERAKLGAFSNRLEHTINNLGTSSENLTSAESRIRDVDMAKEMSTFSKNNILSQAAQAMLAQANQQPQQVLQLLR
jgi:flagellin